MTMDNKTYDHACTWGRASTSPGQLQEVASQEKGQHTHTHTHTHMFTYIHIHRYIYIYKYIYIYIYTYIYT